MWLRQVRMQYHDNRHSWGELAWVSGENFDESLWVFDERTSTNVLWEARLERISTNVFYYFIFYLLRYFRAESSASFKTTIFIILGPSLIGLRRSFQLSTTIFIILGPSLIGLRRPFLFLRSLSWPFSALKSAANFLFGTKTILTESSTMYTGFVLYI
jgi:hypothetical protein